MEIVDFKERNREYAKDQPEYLTMPAYVSKSNDVTSCWKFSLKERLRILWYGRVYFTLVTFNGSPQPQRASTKFDEN